MVLTNRIVEFILTEQRLFSQDQIRSLSPPSIQSPLSISPKAFGIVSKLILENPLRGNVNEQILDALTRAGFSEADLTEMKENLLAIRIDQIISNPHS